MKTDILIHDRNQNIFLICRKKNKKEYIKMSVNISFGYLNEDEDEQEYFMEREIDNDLCLCEIEYIKNNNKCLIVNVDDEINNSTSHSEKIDYKTLKHILTFMLIQKYPGIREIIIMDERNKIKTYIPI